MDLSFSYSYVGENCCGPNIYIFGYFTNTFSNVLFLRRPKLLKIDRSSKQCHTVSVNSVSVVIKEYKLLQAE